MGLQIRQKTVLAGADFRFRRPKSDRLLDETHQKDSLRNCGADDLAFSMGTTLPDEFGHQRRGGRVPFVWSLTGSCRMARMVGIERQAPMSSFGCRIRTAHVSRCVRVLVCSSAGAARYSPYFKWTVSGWLHLPPTTAQVKH